MRIYPSPATQQKICSFYQRRGIPLLEEDAFPEELRYAKPQGKYIAQHTIPREKLVSLAYAERRLLPAPPDAEQNIEADDLQRQLDKALSRLTDNERTVIESLFGLGEEPVQTHEQIAAKIGTHRHYVGQIRDRALDKLRRRGVGLREFYE